MIEIKAPGPLPAKMRTLFLAGSIEQGLAADWQSDVVRMLQDTDWTVLNPRRDDWDSSWEQTIEFEPFRNQVEWELDAMGLADQVLMYFDPETKSPITLLELGLIVGNPETNHRLMVVCPSGFWRKGNVDIVCTRYSVKLYVDLFDAVEQLKIDIAESRVG